MAVQGTRYIVTTGATILARATDAGGALACVVVNNGAGTINLGGGAGSLGVTLPAGSIIQMLLLQGDDVLYGGVVGGFGTIDVLAAHRSA